MAAQQTYPRWLINCKQGISDSKEWNTFLAELHEAIQQQLTESHVQYFTDLSEAEKDLFMERATAAIEGGGIFTNLSKKVSVLLDQHLNEEVSRQLLEDAPVGTKSDLIIENAEEGSISMLKKWPDMKNKLNICLNQALPLPLRMVAWRLYLVNNRVRKHYVDQLNSNPRAAISPYDLEITQTCEALINTEPTFADLKGSVGSFYAMKAVLSYYHASLKTKNRLRDVDYLLVVPFVKVNDSNMPKREPPAGRTIAALVEQYISYMESRPGFVTDTGSDKHEDEMAAFVDKIGKELQLKFPSVAKAVVNNVVSTKEKIVETETGKYALLMEGLTSLVRPVIRSMFVTYLNFDTLLYVWDQYMIGSNTPGFHTEWLANVTLVFLGLLREKLKDADSAAAMEKVLKTEGPRLMIPQFQYEVKTDHYKGLYSMLQQDQKAAMPVLDPTQSEHPPWRHWYNDVIPPYTKPQERRRAREEREAERERMARMQKDNEISKREQAIKERRLGKIREEDDDYQRMAAGERQRLETERMKLEEMVQEERRKRLQAEQRAREQIDRLQMEVAALSHSKPRSRASTTRSSAVISRFCVAPPPTRVSSPELLPPIMENKRAPTPAASPDNQTREVLIDFLQRVKLGADKIAHGQGEEKAELDKETDGYLQQNVKDIKRAQRDILGHTLKPGEFDRMSPTSQQNISEQMMKMMQKWREDRRARELQQTPGSRKNSRLANR
ncbi:uncharacterized protein LOC110461920 isoform X2 [Mizuhopecten yessoensis]|uniref:uncharacterized protein LOC110461920 isoform X2 n=1 Tax=Mizuhopecten yessoensis TaxID=6573 RepID=UPI000B45C4AF|nr:uncharacterized protein LOC110461920 isoform X2 [Mizuhopecten yessoensis]